MNPSEIKGIVVAGRSLTLEAMEKSRALADKLASEGRVASGITTGFGEFQRVAVPKEMSNQLSTTNLILCHCTAAGEPYDPEISRGMMLLRANALCGGVSGVRPILVQMLDREIWPDIRACEEMIRSGELLEIVERFLPDLNKGAPG